MTSEELVQRLRQVRAQQLALFEPMDEGDLLGHPEHGMEPPIWEMGHVVWFQEQYLLRRHSGAESLLPGSDGIYDSFNVSYKKRWSHNFPSKAETLAYGERVLDAVAEQVAGREASAEEEELYRLIADHESMHTENLAALRRKLGYRAAPSTDATPVVDPSFVLGDVDVPGGEFPLGASPAQGFVLDNEKWQHTVEVAPFRIANTAVSNAQFMEFVEADGYGNRALWNKDGWNWRRRAKIDRPLYWKKIDGLWQEERGDGWQEIEPWSAMCHLNLHEARAYCEFAGRRLPTEAEWEMAASWDPASQQKRIYPWGDAAPTAAHVHMDRDGGSTIDVRAKPAGDSAFGCRQMLGNVWEWTSSKFEPYPGFVPSAYEDYSLPYFGKKPVLRGGAWATSSSLIRNTWRNFFIKHRRNIFAGIRTCAR